jgi:hypothetical protein
MIDIMELRNNDYLQYELKQDGNHNWQLYCKNIKTEEQIIINNGVKIKNIAEFSDGYHTFEELYEFRKLYNANLFNEWTKRSDIEVYKSRRNFYGEYCFNDENWFIVVAVLPNGKQISNHYEMKDWDLFKIPEYFKEKYEFDGYTPKDVLERLEEVINYEKN